LGNGR